MGGLLILTGVFCGLTTAVVVLHAVVVLALGGPCWRWCMHTSLATKYQYMAPEKQTGSAAQTFLFEMHPIPSALESTPEDEAV